MPARNWRYRGGVHDFTVDKKSCPRGPEAGLEDLVSCFLLG